MKAAKILRFVLAPLFLGPLFPVAIAQDECLANLHHESFYINGTWVKPTAPQTKMQVMNPSTASTITSISLASAADVDAAVQAARDALQKWSLETTVAQRQQYVERLLELYTQRQEEMAQLISMEMGAPIDMARDSHVPAGVYNIADALAALDDFEFEWNLDHTRILQEPIGVVAMITPWNWPMHQVTLKVVPALLVGCTCILKPSELAPLSSLWFAQLVHEAGFPPGVFNLVNGDGVGAGSLLSRHVDVDMVSFTGSTRAGVLVTAAAAPTLKRVRLELGGKGANLIFADVANVEEVVTEGVHDCFNNAGQSCNAPTRMLVEQSIYDAAVEIARTVANAVEVKSAAEPGDHMGPVVSLQQWQKVQNYIRAGLEEGAHLVAGGLERPSNESSAGYFVRPTVFADVTSNMTIMQQEIFGPVLCIMPFDTEEQALAIANDTPYGLTNYVHTSSRNRRSRLARQLQSGMVEMNGVGWADGSPFGGIRASGNAREGGVWGLEEYTQVKAVTGFWLEDVAGG